MPDAKTRSSLNNPSVSDIFLYFLKLGSIGFGGPVALTAIMQKELVYEKNWMSRDEFDRAFPLIKAMPGALAFQTAAYIGNACHGFSGALAAGFGLVFPASVLMIFLASFSQELNRQPWVHSVLAGFQAGALALIFIACWQLAKPFRKDFVWWIFSGLAFLIVLNGAVEPLVIIAVGIANVLRRSWTSRSESLKAVPLLELLWISFSAGAFVFGTGLAALPWMESQMVQVHNWLSKEDFLQAVALGQITPGPVLVTTTYIGFKLAGLSGAVLATIAIFLPGLIHMTTWFPRMVNRLARTRWIEAFSAGALAAVVATLVYVIYKYLPQPNDITFWVFITMTSILLFRKNWPAWIVIGSSGLIGLGSYLFN